MPLGTLNLEVKIGAGAPARLDKALALGLPDDAGLSRSRISELIRAGCVRLGSTIVSEPDAKIEVGQVYTIENKRDVSNNLRPEDIPLKIIYEDSDLIVIDKPAGLVVHPGRGNWSGTLVNALLSHCGEDIRTLCHSNRPGIVHRLDKDTSGVMVTAKSERAMLSLSTQFSNRTVARRYHALIRGLPKANLIGQHVQANAVKVNFETNGWICIDAAIDRHPSHRFRQSVVQTGGRDAVTRIRPIQSLADGAISLVECKLETGRTHQIRVHLESLGHPVIGDQTYGTALRLLPESAGREARDAAANFSRQALHAVSLGFLHPTSGKQMHFESDYPRDMRHLLSLLSKLSA